MLVNVRAKTVVLVATPVALALAGLAWITRDPPSGPSAVSGRLAGQNVLLITLDTTRSDRLGCFGHKLAATPVLDAMAARGTLFENAFAQVPLTLPSHASMLTGRYPREHGVRDNARNALGSTHPTLATIFKQHGYRTAAFLASFVLDSRFGLDRGFDLYEDDMGHVSYETQPLQWQQPANVVTDRALAWLEIQKSQPFFCWVHYYDAHDPYEPPAEFRPADGRVYDGELAFVDSQVKRLSDWLDANALTDRTLVIVVGDHGESFAEHGERGHTNFVYRTNLQVPLIFASPAAVPAGQRLPAIVEIVDVFSTVIELFGWERPAGLLSRSLAGAFASRKLVDAEAYSESNYVFDSYGWAEQRGLTTSRWKYISSTKPELYDRQSDPDETKNLIANEPKVADRLRKALSARYDAMVPGEAALAPMDAAASQAHKSLGYMGGSRSTSDEFLTRNLPDPKDMVEVVQRFMMARGIVEESDRPEEFALAVPLLMNIVEESPNSMMFHYMLGSCHLKLGEPAEALPALEAAKEIDRGYVPVLISLGDALLALNRVEEARQQYREALSSDERNPEVRGRIADLSHRLGQTDEAIEQVREAIRLFPNFARAHSRLGDFLTFKGRVPEALHEYQTAVGLKPDDPEFHLKLGLGLVQTQQLSAAVVEFREAVRLRPDHGEATLNLGLALMRQGLLTEAKEAFATALSIPDFAADANYAMGTVLVQEGQIHETVELYERAIALKPTHLGAIDELSTHYLGVGRVADAIRILRIGTTSLSDNPQLSHRLATVLATSRHDDLRDGASAVVLAERAAALTQRSEPVVLQTLAAAYAEAGMFDKAVAECVEAIKAAEDRGQPALADSLQKQMDQYLRSEPYRDPRF
jgi:arylsulfatase A-like enzyme/Flp pilus assembly protein TadD